MTPTGASLGEFFRRRSSRDEPIVLATITETLGSTYRKAGAQMLIGSDGQAAGLLSGGCLEADLMERARTVLDTGQALTVQYDTRSSDDVLWGIGLGCEGAMSILLVRIDRQNAYQPFAFIDHCRREDTPGSFALVTATSNDAHPLGQSYMSGDSPLAPREVADALEAARSRNASVTSVEAENAQFLIVPVELPPRLLVLGAGPDAMPLVEIAGLMNWHVTVLDHRPAYAVPERFPRAARVEVKSPAALSEDLKAHRYDAAVVMSHHLRSDEAYLSALADQPSVPYVGLLGPAPRRARLMKELADKASLLTGRLHGPVGLDIGAKTPETIALAIVSQIQAHLAGRPGGPFAV